MFPRSLQLGLWALASLVFGVSSAVAQLKLYDNFNSNHINPSKWVGERSSPQGSDANRREVSVQIVGQPDHQLSISERVYAPKTDNAGDSGTGFGLGFASPSKVTAVSFNMTVATESVTSCAGNPNVGFALAGFFGDYFNPTGATNGAVGDIVTAVQVSRITGQPARTLSVAGSVSRCVDSLCDNQTILSNSDLGSVALGSTNTFSVTWDHANHQFIFQLNNNAPVQSPYTVSDDFPPGLPDKSFFVFGEVAHCTTTPRPAASIQALFDNVYVNR